jgi:hypothetical protein
MKFMLQIIADVSIFGSATAEEFRAFDARILAFNGALADAGAWVTAEGLDDPGSSVTVRFENGSQAIVSNGPFADRDEQLVGFWIIDVPTVDDAVDWARKAPVASGAIEVRPLVPPTD